MVLAPNLLLLWPPPLGPNVVARVPRLLEGGERAGQALCLVVPAVTLPGTIVGGRGLPAAVVLAIGHVPVSLLTRRAIRSAPSE